MGPFAQLFGSDCKGNWEKTKKGNINVSSLADAKIQHFIAFCKHDGRNVDKKRWVSVGDKKSGRWSRGGAFGILRE